MKGCGLIPEMDKKETLEATPASSNHPSLATGSCFAVLSDC